MRQTEPRAAPNETSSRREIPACETVHERVVTCASAIRTSPSLSEVELGVLAVLIRRALDTSDDVTNPGFPKGSYSVSIDDVRRACRGANPKRAVLGLVGRHAEWDDHGAGVTPSPGEWSAVPLLSEAHVDHGVVRYAYGPTLDRWLGQHRLGQNAETGSELDGRQALVGRLAEFGLSEIQTERSLALPRGQVVRNLAYVEEQIMRGWEISALGAYTYRAVLADWARSAEAAQRKSDAVRRLTEAGARAACRAVFPAPALSAAGRKQTGSACTGRGPHVGACAEGHVGSGEEASVEPSAPRKGPDCEDVARRSDPARRAGLRTVACALVLSASACSPGRDRHEERRAPSPTEQLAPRALVGVWDLAATAADFGECHEASIGYRADGRYVTRGGAQVVAGRYSARLVSSGAVRLGPEGADHRLRFVVDQRPEVHNDQANCQGFSAEDAIAASPRTALVEVETASGGEPSRAWIYFGDQNAAPAAELVRRTAGR